MSVRALAANNELIANTDTLVTSNLSIAVRAFLPAINAGAGATVAVGTEIRVQSLSETSIDLVSLDGHQVGRVGPFASALVVAKAGAAQGKGDIWVLDVLPQAPAATVAAAGATYTATEQGLLNAMRTALIDAGLLKAE